MLIQSDGDRIDLLPAVPESWGTLAFQLWGVNRTRVNVSVEDGRLRELTVAGPAGERRIRVPARFGASELLGSPAAVEGAWEVFVVQPDAEPDAG